MGMGDQYHAPTAQPPERHTEASWVPRPLWMGEKILAPSGSDPWTVSLVAIRYTDWGLLDNQKGCSA
jgi:hypothetical protein